MDYLGVVTALLGGLFLWFGVLYYGLKRKKLELNRMEAAFGRTLQAWMDFLEALDKQIESTHPHKAIVRSELNKALPEHTYTQAEVSFWLKNQAKTWSVILPLIEEKEIQVNQEFHDAGVVLHRNLSLAWKNVRTFRNDFRDNSQHFPNSVILKFI